MSRTESTVNDLDDRSVIVIPRSFVCTGLFLVFFMAFIFVPYWEFAWEPWRTVRSQMAGRYLLG